MPASGCHAQRVEIGRRLAPTASALAVLAVVAGTWMLTGPGHDGTPSRRPTALPSVTSGGFIGGPPRTPVSTHPPLTVLRGVPIDRYSVVDPTHLLLSYTVGVTGGCAGVIEQPRVQESTGAVTITLRQHPQGGSGSCPHLALMEAVTVPLRAPLAGRQVRDGATGGTAVPRGPRPAP